MLLQVDSINAFYGEVQALFNVSLKVEKGEAVSLIGANGAGKSTTLMTIAGQLKPKSGSIKLKNEEISGLKPEQASRKGVILVPEGRMIFPGLTVEENLEIGTCPWRKKQSEDISKDLEEMYNLFPRLAERKNQLGWCLSGGEQQMLSLSRGLMGRPEILLMDEPSLGLAPNLVETVFEVIKGLKEERNITILLVEQNAFMALEVADRAYVIQTGEIVMEGSAHEIAEDEGVRKAYLGT